MTLVDQPNNTPSFLFLCSTRTTPQYKILIKKALNHQYQMLLLLLLLFAASLSTRDVYCQEQQLMVGFYTDRCPDAESIVTSTVGEVASSAPNTPALLLRLHFHDCFVQGCDGSILIQNGNNAEKNAFGHQGVGGFDVIDKAKSKLEAVCPGVVSCSDIVALAARDAIALANGPAYQVQTGRRDGMVSDMSLAVNMPDVQDSIEVIKSKFREKGLTDRDLVLLSAAHTIGTTACFFMTNRLYQFPSPGGSDPSINPNLLPELKQTCPKGGNNGVRLEIDRGSGNKFDDNILQNIRNGFAVLQSDARLYQDDATKAVVDSYFGLLTPIFGPSFEADFVEAIVKMGAIGVKTGSSGTIRKVCSAVN